MNNKLVLIGPMHEQSTRVKNKMIREFGESTLADIFINKLEELAKHTDIIDRVVLPISPKDKILWEKAQNSTLEVIERDDQSIESSNISPKSIHNYLNDFEEDYVMWLNGCFPFLEVDTILETAKYFKDNKDKLESLTVVKKAYNQFWDINNNEPINNREQIKSTKDLQPIYETVHNIFIYPRKFMLETDKYWNYQEGDPHLYEVEDSIEFLDIDTELEFKICELIYYGLF